MLLPRTSVLNSQTCKSTLKSVGVTAMTRSRTVSQAAETDKRRKSVLMRVNLFIQVMSRTGLTKPNMDFYWQGWDEREVEFQAG